MVVFVLQKVAVSNVLETGASLLKPRLTKEIGQIYQAQDRPQFRAARPKTISCRKWRGHVPVEEVEGACPGRGRTPLAMYYSFFAPVCVQYLFSHFTLLARRLIMKNDGLKF